MVCEARARADVSAARAVRRRLWQQVLARRNQPPWHAVLAATTPVELITART